MGHSKLSTCNSKLMQCWKHLKKRTDAVEEGESIKGRSHDALIPVSTTLRRHKSNSLKTMTTFTPTTVHAAPIRIPCEWSFSRFTEGKLYEETNSDRGERRQYQQEDCIGPRGINWIPTTASCAIFLFPVFTQRPLKHRRAEQKAASTDKDWLSRV